MRKLAFILVWLVLPVVLEAQSASFYHLTTANGLTDNNTQCVAIDKNGFLWIGTANGLNRYDGYLVVRYSSNQQTGLCSNNITTLFCDKRNRIWAGTINGITMIDENRLFHRIAINDSLTSNYSCSGIMETSSRGIVVHTNRGSFSLDEKTNKWTRLEWASDIVHTLGLRDNALLKEELYIQTGADKVMILDYRTQKMIFDLPLTYSISACRLNDDEIIAATYKGKLCRLSISQHKIIKEYSLVYSEAGKIVNSSINKVRQSPNGKIIVTGSGGLFIFDPVSETFSSYTHDPLQPTSISAGGMEKVFCDQKGNVFVTSSDQGLSYFNILEYKAVSKTAFIATGNQIYDSYINDIDKDAKGRLWLAGHDCFLIWDRKNDQSLIYRYYYRILNSSERPLGINCIYFDRKGQTWIGTQGGGMGLFDEHTGSIIKFTQDSVNAVPNFANNFVRDIIPVSDDSLWIATNAGIVTFNINTHRYDTVHNSPALKTLRNRIIVKCFKASNSCILLSRLNSGVYCYNPATQTIKKYPTSGTYYSFVESEGNIYMAGSDGFACINARGDITIYNGSKGLRYDDCEAVLKDNDGNIWISNRNCLAKFDPVKKQFQFFDEKSGLTNAGFRPSASFDDKDGHQYWGTINGLNYFFPANLQPDTSAVNPIIYQADLADTSLYLVSAPSVNVGYNKNIITFSFAAISFYNEKGIFYQYQLEGLDKGWINSLGSRQVRYTSLPPATYTFKVRASRDGVSWTEASNSIRVRVHPAFWQRWWFKAGLVLLFASLVFWFFRMRISKIKETEALRRQYEKKIAAVEMGSLRAQMNPHFMFNSLNSINNFILKNDPDNASGYLTKFSRLMRLILDNSRNEWVLLENELRALELYIELEALRFDNAFDHRTEITADVNPEAVLVPPMIIQPYVENAIWHGLLHRKDPGGKLDIHIWKNNGMLHIEIEDNGIGREEARKRKSKTATKQKSHGMDITNQRLEIVNKLYDVHASVAIKDLVTADGAAEGTVVSLSMFYKTS